MRYLSDVFSVAAVYLEKYICNSLSSQELRDRFALYQLVDAIAVIHDRLGNCVSVEQWLVENVPTLTIEYLHSDEGRIQVKLYRTEWLKNLSQEFNKL